jgi:hypothetical protein
MHIHDLWAKWGSAALDLITMLEFLQDLRGSIRLLVWMTDSKCLVEVGADLLEGGFLADNLHQLLRARGIARLDQDKQIPQQVTIVVRAIVARCSDRVV